MAIAVIGAGMGGLAAAGLLARGGHAVQLFERFAQAGPVGSGLVVQPVGLAVLDALGAGRAARALGVPLQRMLGWSGPRRALDVAYRGRAPGLAMHRSALFHVLWQAMRASGRVEVMQGCTITAAPPAGSGGGRWLESSEGARFGPFDLVVDAAGAHSPLSPLRARPLPFGAIWGHVPWPEACALPRNVLSQRYRGARQMAGVLPIGCLPGDSRPRAAIFWSMEDEGLKRWPDRGLEDWKSEVLELWPQMAPFLAGIDTAAQMTVARYGHGALLRPDEPGMLHIGDAAHRASPQLGQGANMALLDAYALALAVQSGGLAGAPRRAALLRRRHVQIYQAMSAVFTPLYQSSGALLPALRDHLLAPISRLGPVRALTTALVSGDLVAPMAGRGHGAGGGVLPPLAPGRPG